MITGINPTSEKVNDSIVISGTGLVQTTAIMVGKGKVSSFTRNSDTQLTLTVPTGATTGEDNGHDSRWHDRQRCHLHGNPVALQAAHLPGWDGGFRLG